MNICMNQKNTTKNTDTHERKVNLEGEEAFLRGLPLTANPYIDGTGDSDLWTLGWRAANSKQPIQPQLKRK